MSEYLPSGALAPHPPHGGGYTGVYASSPNLRPSPYRYPSTPDLSSTHDLSSSLPMHALGPNHQLGSATNLISDSGDGDGDGYKPSGYNAYSQPRAYRQQPSPRKSGKTTRRLRWIIPLVAIAVIAIALAIAIPMVLRNNKSTSAATPSTSPGSKTTTASSPSATQFNGATSGGSGSLVTMSNGVTFTYQNPYGGNWIFDPANPFNSGARAQSWSPALNETWQYGVDVIRGVNLGGWLVTEPFIVPSLYEPYANESSPAIDEWSLVEAIEAAGLNATAVLEQHYETFITEEDFANIAGAGLNWVRIPIPYWAIEIYPNESFVPHLAWTYFLKAIQWARKYGLRINMDLHAVPGSQNGWNHSGKSGKVNFMFGTMGIANAQRTMAYIRTLTEFVSQPEYSNVVPMFGILNEALVPTIGLQQIRQFYFETYNMMRSISGIGEGNGPAMSIHDGFQNIANWTGYMSGADRLFIDTHQYTAFTDPRITDLFTLNTVPCSEWAPGLNVSMGDFGMTTGGEWSVALNDCGRWLNGVNAGALFDGTAGSQPAVGSCEDWTDWPNFNASMKAGLMQYAMAQMDGLQNWFFWTWKIGNSTVTGKVEAPTWSYSLGLQQGWIPTDPRKAVGFCSSDLGVVMNQPAPALSAWMTGGAGAGTILATQSSSYGQWPIESMFSVSSLSYIPPASVSLLPQYTPTGAPVTLQAILPAATPQPNGWANSADTAGYYVNISGCAYPNQWDAISAAIPAGSACLPSATAAKRAPAVPFAMRTPPPTL